jgi:hypothetical protein
MVLMLVGMLVPQVAWADTSGLEKAFIGDKSYYVLRSNADWEKFRLLVADAEGKSEVNAIMDADFTVTSYVGLTAWPYKGTFNGNGHTLTVNYNNTDYYTAPFPAVKDATFINLYVAGSIKSTQKFSAGLVGYVVANSSLLIERCVSSVDLYSSIYGDATNGGFVGINNEYNAEVVIKSCKFEGKFRGPIAMPMAVS